MKRSAPLAEIRVLLGSRGVAAITVALLRLNDAFVRLIPGWDGFAQTPPCGRR